MIARLGRRIQVSIVLLDGRTAVQIPSDAQSIEAKRGYIFSQPILGKII